MASRWSNPCEKPERAKRVGHSPANVTELHVGSVAEGRQQAGEWFAKTTGRGFWPKGDTMSDFEAALRLVGRARLACMDQHLLVINDAAAGSKPAAT